MSYEHVKRSRAKRKRQLVDYLGGKCIKCGYNKSIYALDFHHVDPSKKDFTVSQSIKSLEACLDEVEKCVLLCSNCHREFHNDEWDIKDVDIPKLSKEKRDEIENKPEIKICKHGLCQRRFLEKRGSNKLYCSRKCCNEWINKEKRSTALGRKIIIPRKDHLEKLVWEKPSTKIAKQYGVSDRTIGKWCEKLGIQKPPRGYWTKKKSD